jgi:hypothetical protein
MLLRINQQLAISATSWPQATGYSRKSKNNSLPPGGIRAQGGSVLPRRSLKNQQIIVADWGIRSATVAEQLIRQQAIGSRPQQRRAGAKPTAHTTADYGDLTDFSGSKPKCEMRYTSAVVSAIRFDANVHTTPAALAITFRKRRAHVSRRVHAPF